MKVSKHAPIALAILALVLAGGCSTLSVKIPDGMYVSMGDYVEGVKTKGIVQVHKTVWTPLVVLYDASQIREDLYKQLLAKTENMVGVDGITNVTFYAKPSAWSVLAAVSFGVGIWMDCYAEGVVIVLKAR